MPRRHTPLPNSLHPSACGGVLRNRRKGRGARSVSVRYSMHLVLRSSLARGVWSFVRDNNRAMIKAVIAKHAARTGIEMLGLGNAGNHLHLRIKVVSRKQYFKFIRAVTGEIALKIKRISNTAVVVNRNFWDKRPFSSIVSTLRYAARLTDYIKINDLEGRGFARAFARLTVERWNREKAKHSHQLRSTS